MTTNPYSAPAATVADPAAAPQGRFIPGGRTVAAGRGWSWFVAAWALFKRQPAVWIGIFLIFAAFIYLSTRIEVIGGLALTLLAPVFGAGIVIGARELDQGADIRLSHLFSGFRERFGALVGVGAIYLAASVVIVVIALMVAGGSVMALAQDGRAAGGDWMAVLASIALFLLVLMALSVPVLMAVWFAPALVAFHERGPLEAMKESFTGCLRNVVPFLVYGVVGVAFAIVASLPAGLGWILFGPVLLASVFTAYKDIYLED